MYSLKHTLKFNSDNTGYWSYEQEDGKEEDGDMLWYITSSDILKIDFGEGEYVYFEYSLKGDKLIIYGFDDEEEVTFTRR